MLCSINLVVNIFAAFMGKVVRSDNLKNSVFNFVSTFGSQIIFKFQNAFHVLVHLYLKSFIMSFTLARKYWKPSTTSSTVPSSIISGIRLIFLASTFILLLFIRNPISLATSDSALSFICAFFVSYSSKLVSLVYSRSPTFFLRILLNLRARVMKPRSSMSVFQITQSVT